MDHDLTQQLLERATLGDARAIDDLLVQYLPALHAFVRLRSGNALAGRESTSDLVQSVCREVLGNAGDYRYRGEAQFKNWLFTAATNKIVDRHRHHRRGKRDAAREARLGVTHDDAPALLEQYAATLGTPSRELMSREAVERIEAVFAELPSQHREVIAMSRIAGMSYAEIGAETGRTEIAVRGLVARGLARLAELLDAE